MLARNTRARAHPYAHARKAISECEKNYNIDKKKFSYMYYPRVLFRPNSGHESLRSSSISNRFEFGVYVIIKHNPHLHQNEDLLL